MKQYVYGCYMTEQTDPPQIVKIILNMSYMFLYIRTRNQVGQWLNVALYRTGL